MTVTQPVTDCRRIKITHPFILFQLGTIFFFLRVFHYNYIFSWQSAIVCWKDVDQNISAWWFSFLFFRKSESSPMIFIYLFFWKVTISELEVQWLLCLTIPCWPCCPDTASLVPCCPVLWPCRTIRVALHVWWEALVVTATLLFAASYHMLNALSERLYMNSLPWSLQIY